MSQIESPHHPFITQATAILFPRIWSVKDRQELLMQAFFTANRWILGQIEVDGSADIFATHCLQVLLERDCSLVEHLLMTVYRSEGETTRTAIDHLLIALHDLCANQPPTPFSSPQPIDLTHETGGNHHPTVFISYADEDRLSAERLHHDLARHGHACFLARSRQKEDEWLAATAEGLSQSYAVIVVVGNRTRQDRWVQVELLAALDKRKQIIPFLVEAYPLPVCLPEDIPTILGYVDYDASLAQLLKRLPTPPTTATTSWTSLDPHLIHRATELVYMDQLKLAELKHVAQYTRLSGTAQRQRTQSGRLTLQPIVARPEFIHRPWRQAEGSPLVVHRFEDAVSELKAIRRAILLGEPGAGKTTTLYRLAADLIDTALLDSSAPIPLMVRLGTWVEETEPFGVFLSRSVGELAEGLESRLKRNRAVLLLDGLNEIPAHQQANKYRQLDQFLARFPELMVVVSCREQDYPADRQLSLDRVTISPLDPVRVHEFIHNYLDPLYGAAAGDALFWQLAGAKASQTYQRFIGDKGEQIDDPFTTFWLVQTLPDNLKWGWSNDNNYYWENWLRDRAYPASLLLLAFNPYLLFMLLDVYQAHGRVLPANRGQLFDQFVATLLVRERLLGWDTQTHTVVRLPQGETLLARLSALALAMQKQRGENEASAGALTALSRDKTSPFLDEGQQYQAVSANLVTVGADVRFTHQLLQEYFAARAMRSYLQGQAATGETRLSVSSIWQSVTGETRLSAPAIWRPDRWWQPTNWEEATILLAGLYDNDCTPVIDWLAEANPELAARCMSESGAYTPDETKKRWRERWLTRLTDVRKEPDIRARAAVGRALGRVYLADGTLLDNRPGVGIVIRDGMKIPDLAWGEAVPAGTYTVGGDKDAARSFDQHQVPIPRAYRLARYPITYAQFACFIEAPDVNDPRWWDGMPAEQEVYGTVYPLREWSDQAFPFGNHPRENVSWYQAVAFCRWLSDKLGYVVELPHETEWEVAARYLDGRLFPWGNEFDASKANTSEGQASIGQTSAVGLYPQGVHKKLGLYDLIGNVWEWCQNKYGDPNEVSVDDSGGWRVLRGGSWYNLQSYARAASRGDGHPFARFDDVGFRVVCRPPSHDH